MLSLLFAYTVLLCCASLGKKYFLYISKMEKNRSLYHGNYFERINAYEFNMNSGPQILN